MLSAVTIALFASVLALSRPAAAADAERSTKNDTIIYQKHTYTRIDKASFASGEKTKSLRVGHAPSGGGVAHEGQDIVKTCKMG